MGSHFTRIVYSREPVDDTVHVLVVGLYLITPINRWWRWCAKKHSDVPTLALKKDTASRLSSQHGPCSNPNAIFSSDSIADTVDRSTATTQESRKNRVAVIFITPTVGVCRCCTSLELFSTPLFVPLIFIKWTSSDCLRVTEGGGRGCHWGRGYNWPGPNQSLCWL